MSSESHVTALLLNPRQLPTGFEEALASAGIETETTTSKQLTTANMVVAPDVIVVAEESYEYCLATLRKEGDFAPVFIVTPALSALRRRREIPPGVCAVVGSDVPLPQLVQRLQDAIRKEKKSTAAKPSVAKTSAAKSTAAKPSVAKSNAAKPSTAKSSAAKPSVAKSNVAKPGAAKVSARKPKSQLSARQTEPQVSAPSVRMTAEKPQISKKRPEADLPQLATAPSLDLELRKPASAPEPPSLHRPPPPSKLMPRRICLLRSALDFQPMRLALIDDDLTRADAISRSFRAAGHEVFLVSNTPARTCFPVLRRFGPHAVVLDEASLRGLGATWLGALRRDPHLRSTPLVAAPFTSLFDEKSGETRLDNVTTQLDGLGNAEAQLLDKIVPGTELEIARALVPLGRLLSILADHVQAFEIECTSTAAGATEVLTLPLSGGACGSAALISSTAPAQTLDPDAALEWLLEHDAPLIVRRARVTGLEASISVADLLEDSYRKSRDLSTPDEAPPQTVTPISNSLEDAGPASVTLPSIAPPHVSAPSAATSVPGSGNNAQAPISLADLRTETPQERMQRLLAPSPEWEAQSETSTRLMALTTNRPPASIESRSRAPLYLIGAAAAALVAVLGFAFVQQAAPEAAAGQADLNNTPEELPANEQLPTSPDAADVALPDVAEEEEPAAQKEKKRASDAELFRVPENKELKSCEELLTRTPEELKEEPSWKGEALWERSRKEVLLGNHDSAHQLMCRAAFIDPEGPASVGLTIYYLGHRALSNAHFWATHGTIHRGDKSLRSEQLLADTYSQMGETEKARQLWLKTLNLDPDDQQVLSRVALTMVDSAKKALDADDPILAERLLRRAASFDPNNIDIALELAAVLGRNGLLDAARLWVERAEGAEPLHPKLHLVLGDIERAANHPELARLQYQQVLPNSVAYHLAQVRLRELSAPAPPGALNPPEDPDKAL